MQSKFIYIYNITQLRKQEIRPSITCCCAEHHPPSPALQVSPALMLRGSTSLRPDRPLCSSGTPRCAHPSDAVEVANGLHKAQVEAARCQEEAVADEVVAAAGGRCSARARSLQQRFLLFCVHR